MLSTEEVENFINTELRKRRWFGQKLEEVRVRIEDIIPLYSSKTIEIAFFILRVEPGGKKYFVPLSFTKSAFHFFDSKANPYIFKKDDERIYIFEAEYLDIYPSLLYNLFEEGKSLRGGKAKLEFVLRQRIRGEHVCKGEVISPDSTNINLKLISTERKMLLKSYRALDIYNPEIEMLLKLSAFKNVPNVIGYAQLEFEGKRANCFLIVEFLEGTGDGIKAFMKDLSFLLTEEKLYDSLLAHGISLASKLGKVTAGMHFHLVGDGEFRLEKVRAEDVECWKARILENFDYCLEKIRSLPQSELSIALQDLIQKVERRRVLEEIENAHTFVGSLKMRTHQDYHLGQVLYSGKDENFYVIDFEGEPGRKGEERREKLPPVRDVATMLRSFSYLKHLAFRNYLEERLSLLGMKEMICWAPAVLSGNSEKISVDKNVVEMLNQFEQKISQSFLKSYIENIKKLNPSLLPDNFQSMLRFWLLEKAIYELRYELEYRLDYAGIPIEGIISALGMRR